MKRIDVNDPAALERATEVLKNGGVIVVPTDTVYGVACDAFNDSAIEKIFTIKERERGKAIPLLVSDRAMLEHVALLDEPLGTALFNFWPGALTAVLLSQSYMSQALRAGTSTIGVRIPNHEFLLNLIKNFTRPLAVTSANKSGAGSYTRIAQVLHDFQGESNLDLVIDAGDLSESLPSTVVDCTKIPPMILREGAISKTDLKAVFDRYFEPVNY